MRASLSMTSSPLQFFGPCPGGLEEALAAELAEIGAAEVEAAQGGVHFRGDWETCWRANLFSRIATRVLYRVQHRRYEGESDIYRAAFETGWGKWFGPRHTIRVHTTAAQAEVRSLDYVTIAIKDALCARFIEEVGERPSVDTEAPDVRVHAFLDASSVTLYLDTSGEPLFKRGYRRMTTEAPIKENLAAGILRLTGWQPGAPLLDPMCGSGTFLLEAAQISLNIAPGADRHFAFEKLKGHQPEAWTRLRNEARARQQRPHTLRIYGSDSDVKAVDVTRRNLQEAGFAQAVRVKRADVLHLAPPADHGVLVTNPPYGVRIGEQRKLAEFYPRLGDALKQNFAGWNCFILSADPRLAKTIGLGTRRRLPLFNGALECRLLEYPIVAGALRRGAGE